jgi:hypothetical protein
MGTKPSNAVNDIARASPNAQARIIVTSLALAAFYLINDWIQHVIFSAGPLPVSIMADRVADLSVGGARLYWRMAAFAIVNVGLFLGYGAILHMCKRGDLARGGPRAWAIIVPCAINVALIASPPSLSQDLYSYMAHGYLGSMPGANPLLQDAYDVAPTPLGRQLLHVGWHGRVPVTPYGILWTRLEMMVMNLTRNDIPTALILFKAIAVAASLASAGLIWSILGGIRPSMQLFGTLLYLWNPVIVVEIAGEGHNDALMVFFVLAAVAACVAGRPTASVAALLLGVITKYVPVMFLPAQLVYLWRTRQAAWWLALEILVALVVVAFIAALLYAPLWAGPHTFDGLLHRGQPMSSASPLGAIHWFLKRSVPASVAGPMAVGAVALPTLAFMAWTSLRARDAAGLARSFAWLAIAYTLLASPDFWPWYFCMPIALIAASDAEALYWLVILMSAAARLCAPLNVLYEEGFLTNVIAKGATTGLCTTLPLVVTCVWLYKRRLRSSSVFA